MTAQFREEITIDGQIYGMETEPLDQFLKDNFVGKIDGTYPYLEAFSTACWRGYIGNWLIDNEQLFLTDISNHSFDETPKIYVVLAENDHRYLADWRKSFFNGRQGNIKAEWYTGKLIIEMGKLIEYVHMGYESIYEKYMLIDIKEGNIIGKSIVTEKPDNI